MKSFLLILLFVFPLIAMGQGSMIEGKITSEESGDPVAGAMVSLKKEGAIVVQIDTDTKGHYAITNVANGVYTIEISKFGFAKIIILDIVLDSPKHIHVSPAFEYGSYDGEEVFEISYKELQRSSNFGVYSPR